MTNKRLLVMSLLLLAAPVAILAQQAADQEEAPPNKDQTIIFRHKACTPEEKLDSIRPDVLVALNKTLDPRARIEIARAANLRFQFSEDKQKQITSYLIQNRNGCTIARMSVVH